jgi:hypothetical protein
MALNVKTTTHLRVLGLLGPHIRIERTPQRFLNRRIRGDHFDGDVGDLEKLVYAVLRLRNSLGGKLGGLLLTSWRSPRRRSRRS